MYYGGGYVAAINAGNLFGHQVDNMTKILLDDSDDNRIMMTMMTPLRMTGG